MKGETINDTTKSKIATIILIRNEISNTYDIRFYLTLPFAQEWYPAYERDSMITAAYIHLSRCLTQTFLDIVLSFRDLIYNQFHIVKYDMYLAYL